MGLYDDVLVPCPSCGQDIIFQAKGNNPGLNEYRLDNAPKDVILACTHHAWECKNCGALACVDVELHYCVRQAGRGQE